VAAFLEDRLRFIDIPAVIDSTLAEAEIQRGDCDLDAIAAADARARRVASRLVETRAAAAAGSRPC
jgi:1-deoxy-D-xylulose 5-phosphate reductoisomerase